MSGRTSSIADAGMPLPPPHSSTRSETNLTSANSCTTVKRGNMFEKLNKVEKVIFDACSITLVLFYSYSAVLQPASTQYHRGIYVVLTYVLVFLLYQSKSRIMRVVDYVLMLLSIASIGYWILNFEVINYRTCAETQLDKICRRDAQFQADICEMPSSHRWWQRTSRLRPS